MEILFNAYVGLVRLLARSSECYLQINTSNLVESQQFQKNPVLCFFLTNLHREVLPYHMSIMFIGAYCRYSCETWLIFHKFLPVTIVIHYPDMMSLCHFVFHHCHNVYGTREFPYVISGQHMFARFSSLLLVPPLTPAIRART